MRYSKASDEIVGDTLGEVWLLSKHLKSLLRRQMQKLPSREVSENDTRYPVDEAGMKAFLETFFTRHIFQVQCSLIEYVSSADFQYLEESNHLRILDIGCGPAVASLALYDILAGTANFDSVSGPQVARITRALNDTSPICLGTGREMIAQYLVQRKVPTGDLPQDTVFALATAFPDNLRQIQRIAHHIGGFDIIFLSYVVNVLADHYTLASVVDSIGRLEQLCQPRGRMLIIQDKFQVSLLERIAQHLGVECNERTVIHEIYPQRGEAEKYTYTYYDCLYAPSGAGVDRRSYLTDSHQGRQLH